MHSITKLCGKYSVAKSLLSDKQNLTKAQYMETSAWSKTLEDQIKEGIKASFTSHHHIHILVDLIWHGMPTHDPEKEEKLLRCLIDVLNA